MDNQNVVILEERGTKLTGIFDYSKDDWVTCMKMGNKWKTT